MVMKILLSSLVVASLVVCFSSIGLADLCLILYLPFEEGGGTETKDMSGNGNIGIIEGKAQWTEDGKYGNAIDLDGVDDYIDIPDSKSLATIDGADAQFTVHFWAKTQATGHEDPRYAKTFIDRRSEGGTGSWVCHAYINDAGSAAVHIRTLIIDTAKYVEATTVINDGDWHHIAITRNKTESVSIYVDGKLEGKDSVDLDTAGKPMYTMIGARRKNDMVSITDYLEGTIDEVAIYNRVLTAEEIMRDMIRGVGVQPSGRLTTTWARIKSPQ